VSVRVFKIKPLAVTYSCMRMHTTIGAAAFHFRVRDGIGWGHSAIAARERVEAALGAPASIVLKSPAMDGWFLLFRETDLALDKG
jgi:hypothetical protein